MVHDKYASYGREIHLYTRMFSNPTGPTPDTTAQNRVLVLNMYLQCSVYFNLEQVFELYFLRNCCWIRHYVRLTWQTLAGTSKLYVVFVIFFVFFQWKNYREISHGWIYCFLSCETRSSTRFSITGSRVSIPPRIENRESSRFSRLATDCQLTFKRYCTTNKFSLELFLFIYSQKTVLKPMYFKHEALHCLKFILRVTVRNVNYICL